MRSPQPPRSPSSSSVPARPASPPRSPWPATASSACWSSAGQPSSLPRATGVSTRTMELLRPGGSRRGAGRGDRRRVAALDGARRWPGRGRPADACVGLPDPRAERRCSARPRPACVPQDHLEPVLLAPPALARPARVELGPSWSPSTATPTASRAVLRDRWPGDADVRARYVVGADGAHSRVRDGARHRDARPGRSAGGSSPCSARRSGTSSATAATASTVGHRRGRRASCCRPAARTAGCRRRLASPRRAARGLHRGARPA